MTNAEAYHAASEKEADYLFGVQYHFDQYFHQLKAVIPLTDVTPENGPTGYIPGSSNIHWQQFAYYLKKYQHHKTSPEIKNKLLQNTEADRTYQKEEVLDSTFFEHLVAQKGINHATAKRGDLILFDTRNLHFATPPKIWRTSFIMDVFLMDKKGRIP